MVRFDLIGRLDDVENHRLTLVTAPAGFGKTWLVSEWLAHRMDYGRAWVTIDTDDNDPIRLLSRLAESIAESLPDWSNMLNTQIADPSLGTSMVLDTMLGAMDSSGMPFVIVIDDGHLLESAGARAIVRHLVRELPQTVNMVIIGRQPPAIPLARLRLAGEVFELTTDDLRCTVDESIRLVEGSLGLDLSPEVVEALHDRTGGWIAGIRLAAAAATRQDDVESIERQLPPVAGLDGTTLEAVGDYLAEEALDHLGESDRQFMLDTSILEAMSGPLCDAITESTGSGRFLEALRQSGSFTIAEDNDTYRYHAIVRDTLRATLHRSQPGRQVELHRRAAAWLRSHGDIVPAIRHAIRAGEVDLASDWTVEVSADLLATGQIETLRYLVEAVAAASESVSLALLTTWCYPILLTDTHETEIDAVLERTLATVRSLPREAADEQPWSSIPEAMHESSEELAKQLEVSLGFRHGDIDRVLSMVDSLGDEQSESGWIEAAAGWLLILQEQPSLGEPLIEHWAEYAFLPENPILAIQAAALGLAATAELTRGDLFRARVTADRAANLLESRGLEMVPQSAVCSLPIGWVAWELGDLDRAEEAIYATIDRIDLSGDTPFVTSAHVLAARIAWSRGVKDAAFVTLDEALVTQAGRRVDGPFLDWLVFERARLHLLDGDPAAAARALPDWRDRLGGDVGTMREILILARLLAAHGEDPGSILDVIPPGLEVTQAHEIERHKIRAIGHLNRKEPEDALDHLADAMRIASFTGHVQTFVDDAAHLGALLPNAVALSGHRLPAVTPPESSGASTSDAPALVEALTDRELEVLALLPSHYTYQDIANELMMSHNTVKAHLRAIYRKLDADRRSQAVDAARSLGLIA